MSDGIGTCPYCAREWQRNVRDMAEGFAAGQRGPVVPIPVSEPPGDNDIVLPMWCRDGDPMNWEPYSRPLRGAEFRTKNSSVTHYLLLRKGEDREVRD